MCVCVCVSVCVCVCVCVCVWRNSPGWFVAPHNQKGINMKLNQHKTAR